ncbi:MAG: AIR synthase-related protein [Patescibacteria group bacterium]|nr:AIR synthase-related protein [Patescibacteria group bacterium]
MPRDAYKNEVIDPGDQASQLAKEVCFESHKNCPAVRIIAHQPGNFRGPVGFNWQPHILRAMAEGTEISWKLLEEIETDGAGGKPQFFALIGTPEVFHGLGWEIICMTADDFTRSGRFPTIMNNTIDTKRVVEKNFHLVKALFEGFGEALRIAGLVNITGEFAIMKHSVTAFCDTDEDGQLILNWSASCLGLCHHDRLIDGSKIKPGMPIIGFEENGYRCNGGTFFTNLILAHWGPDIKKILGNQTAIEFTRKLTVPSVYYGKTLIRVNGWNPDGSIADPIVNMAGIAHITGGGIWGKFRELLPEGVGANLNTMPKPPEILREAQELSLSHKGLELSDLQAHGTFHGGCGMIVVCASEKDADTLIEEAAKDGIRANRIGETTESPMREVIINSQFKEGRILSSNEL